MTYLDHNATTPVAPEVREAMMPFLGDDFGNPSSPYRLGSRAHRALERAREQVATFVGASDPEEITFTSGGTEANNTALSSALRARPACRHLVITGVEHSAILKHADFLARQSYEITRLLPDRDGRFDPQAVADAIRPGETAIVSVMWANNETGVLSPVAEIAAACAERGVLFHTDAVQAAGKVPLNFSRVRGLAYAAISGHKFHAPKGIGALWARRNAPFTSYLHGGGQEEGRRAGTENMPGIVAMGRAAELAASFSGHAEIAARRDALESGLLEAIPGSEVNGVAPRVPNTTNVFLPDLESGALLLLLDKADLYASGGSACSSGSTHPSHVLKAMGHSDARARGSLRLSLSRYTTDADIARALEVIPAAVEKLRMLAPAVA